MTIQQSGPPKDSAGKSSIEADRPIEDNRYSTQGAIKTDKKGNMQPDERVATSEHEATQADAQINDDYYGETRTKREGGSVGGRMGE